MVVDERGVVLWRTFVSTLFATLLRNHKNYRDTIVPVGSSAMSAVIKLVNLMLIGQFYEHFDAVSILDKSISDWFPLQPGVRQGCTLSPIQFIVATCIEWTMRKTTDKPRGIQWTLMSFLEDLDFAADLALLSSKITCRTKQLDYVVLAIRLGSL